MLKLLLCLLPVLVQAQHPDSLRSFIGIPLYKLGGIPYALQPKGIKQGLQVYAIQEKQLKEPGNVAIRKAHLYYYENQLYLVEIIVEGRAASETMLKYLKLLLGTGEQDGYAPSYQWVGQRYEVEYDENIITGNATIELVDKRVLAQIQNRYRARQDQE